MSEIEAFVDADRAAQFLSVTRRRAIELARAGQIPAHPLGGGKRKIWRFRLTELATALVTNEQGNANGKRGIMNPGGPLAVPKGKGR